MGYEVFELNTIKDMMDRAYAGILKEMTGIDFFEACLRLSAFGNTTGIEPDTAYFLISFIKRFKLKNIVEYGSGMSTLFLAKYCSLHNLSFISFEEEQKYLDITNKLLEAYNLTNLVQLYTEPNELVLKPDLLYLDSSIALRQTILFSDMGKNVKFVTVHDLEAISPICSEFMAKQKRYDFTVLGTHNTFRLLFVSYLDRTETRDFIIDKLRITNLQLKDIDC